MKQAKLDNFSDVIFNSTPGNCVVVNDQGKIVKVNLNWNKFAIENGIDADINWTGQNYLEVWH